MNFLKKYWHLILLCFIFAMSFALRMETYFLNRPLWHDEAQLVDNFIKNSGWSFLWAFKPLLNFQMAPPLFLASIKIITLFFGFSEQALRFFPFLCSIFSIPVFYKFSKIFLKNFSSIILANSLFAINSMLLCYSCEIKQYSLDALIFMLIFIWLNNIKIDEITPKKALKYGIIFSIAFLFSMPSIFALCGFICYFLLKDIKNNKITNLNLYIIPVLPLIFAFLYKISTPAELLDFMKYYWGNLGISFITPDNFISSILVNCKYYFGNKFHIIFFLFILCGFIIFSFKKDKLNRIFLLSLLSVVCLSALKMYPFYERLILFLCPFFIIFIAQCFDFKILKNTIIPKIIIIFSIISILFTQINFKQQVEKLLNISDARNLAYILKMEFDYENDILILPKSAYTIYTYYSKITNFNIPEEKIFIIPTANENETKKALDDIKKVSRKAQYYWVFAPNKINFSPSNKNRLNSIKCIYKYVSKDSSIHKIKL